MRKMFLIGFIFLLLLAISTPAYCQSPMKKLGRGLCNIVTFPLEVPEQIQRVNNQDGPMAGLTYGILKGIGMMGVRAMVGVYELATFPIPLPKDYKPILTDPEFFFEEKNW